MDMDVDDQSDDDLESVYCAKTLKQDASHRLVHQLEKKCRERFQSLSQAPS